jgi:hypothetical protein
VALHSAQPLEEQGFKCEEIEPTSQSHSLKDKQFKAAHALERPSDINHGEEIICEAA